MDKTLEMKVKDLSEFKERHGIKVRQEIFEFYPIWMRWAIFPNVLKETTILNICSDLQLLTNLLLQVKGEDSLDNGEDKKDAKTSGVLVN